MCAVDKEGDSVRQEQTYIRFRQGGQQYETETDVYTRETRREIAWNKDRHIRAVDKEEDSVRQGQKYLCGRQGEQHRGTRTNIYGGKQGERQCARSTDCDAIHPCLIIDAFFYDMEFRAVSDDSLPGI